MFDREGVKSMDGHLTDVTKQPRKHISLLPIHCPFAEAPGVFGLTVTCKHSKPIILIGLCRQDQEQDNLGETIGKIYQ